MFYNYYSTIFKKKSIQFLFNELLHSYKKNHIVISLINLDKFHCLDIKITLQYYLGINKFNLKFFSMKELLKFQKHCFLIKLFTIKIKCIFSYFKRVILIEPSNNLILYSFIQGRLKVKKLSIRAFFLKDEELFYKNEKLMSFYNK